MEEVEVLMNVFIASKAGRYREVSGSYKISEN